MSLVYDPAEMDGALDKAFVHDDIVIVEQFVEGVEITVPILGNDKLEILPIVEIVPHSGFYDYEAKYTAGKTDEICPARLTNDTEAECRRLALLSHELLGCRGMSRTDMIVDKNGEPWVLEVNTIPGMTPLSLLPCSASVAGYSFPALLDRLIELALEG
jgi:D-alanine-D-alanine ligase